MRPVSASEPHGYLDTPDDTLPLASSGSAMTARDLVSLPMGESVGFVVRRTVASLYTATVATPGLLLVGGVVRRPVAPCRRNFRLGGSDAGVKHRGEGAEFRFTAGWEIPLRLLELLPVSHRMMWRPA